MGFIKRRTSKQTSKVKTLFGLTLTRVIVARRPRLARKSISISDVNQLIALDHFDRALHRAEQVIQEDNILEAFNIIELHCNRLIENANECGEDTREAVVGIMFAVGWCGDLPELLFARTILENKFGLDFAMMAKEGTGVLDSMLVWKLSGNKRNMELKKKVVKEIAAENNIKVNFSEFLEVAEQDGCDNVPHHQELNHKVIYQINMDESSESDSDHSSSHNEDPCDISDSDGYGSKRVQPKERRREHQCTQEDELLVHPAQMQQDELSNHPDQMQQSGMRQCYV